MVAFDAASTSERDPLCLNPFRQWALFEGFDHMEEALMLMKEKPADLIKPLVVI